jgi:TRAP-type transport system periplasmic protein
MNMLLKAAGLAVAISGLAIAPTLAQTTLRLGTVLAASDPMGQGLDKFKQDVEAATGGAVLVEIFHNSQLGDTGEMLDQARAGANVGTVTDIARFSSFVPSLAIMSAPFMFDTYKEADQFAISDQYREWADLLEERADIVLLASNWYQGPRHLLTQVPVSSPADLAGIRMRTIDSPVWIETIRAMGAVPTPAPWGEVYTGLQMGVLSGAEAQPTAITGAKLYEVVSNVTLTGHIHLVTALVVGAETWKSISPENQEIVRNLAVENGRYASQLTLDLGDAAMAEVAAAGVEVSEVDLAPFKEAVSGVYELVDLTNEAEIVRQILNK